MSHIISEISRILIIILLFDTFNIKHNSNINCIYFIFNLKLSIILSLDNYIHASFILVFILCCQPSHALSLIYMFGCIDCICFKALKFISTQGLGFG